jgi:hypothetical protein
MVNAFSCLVTAIEGVSESGIALIDPYKVVLDHWRSLPYPTTGHFPDGVVRVHHDQVNLQSLTSPAYILLGWIYPWTGIEDLSQLIFDDSTVIG